MSRCRGVSQLHCRLPRYNGPLSEQTELHCEPSNPLQHAKRPEPQICLQFVPAIVFKGSNQGDWACQNLPENSNFSSFDQFWTSSSLPDWNPQKQLPGKILDKFGVQGVLHVVRGWRVRKNSKQMGVFDLPRMTRLQFLQQDQKGKAYWLGPRRLTTSQETPPHHQGRESG